MSRVLPASWVLILGVFAAAQPEKASAPPPDSLAFASLDVARLWEHPSFLSIREAPGKFEFAWVVQSVFGVAPQDIARLSVFWHPAAPGEPFALITGRKKLDATAVAKSLQRPGEKPPKAPEKVVTAAGSEFPFLLQVDERTVLLAPGKADPAKLERLAGMKGRLGAAIDSAGKHTLTVGVDVATLASFPLPVGGPLLQAETAILTADLGEKAGKAELRLAFAEAADAKKAAPFLKTKLDELGGYVAAQEKKASAKGQVGTSYPAPLLEWVATTLKNAKVKADGTTATATVDLRLEEGFTALLSALPDSSFSPRGSSAAENNMKQIILAMHNYADANAAFVSNSYDKDGKPLLSWRVHLLPYIEQDAVYRRFKLDEPWDSPNNKPLSDLAIKVFQVPGRPAAKPNETYFRGFIGPKDVKPEHRPWLLEGQSKGPQFPAIFTDGTSNTLLVAEAAESVPWAKPDDLFYDGVKPLPKLGGPNGTWVAGIADGSVRTFRRNQIDEKNLRHFISVMDGNVLNLPER
ncbi:MAG: DUF1559 domain-containing protein [Gemmataceae bacterium]